MKFKMPHTLTLLFFLMVAALFATWIIPQGQFETELVNGREVVLPGTYEVAEDREFMNPVELFLSVPRAFADAQAIIFFLFIIGGVLASSEKPEPLMLFSGGFSKILAAGLQYLFFWLYSFLLLPPA